MRCNVKTLGSILLSMVLISTLTLAFTSFPATAQGETYERFGPRVDNLLIKVYLAGRDAEFEALRTGQIDIIDWPLDYTTYTQLLADPDHFVVEPLTMIDMYNLEMNCIKWPTSDVYVRRAIAHLFNRTRFLQLQLKSFSGVMLDSPIASEWEQWHNDYVRQYPFDRATAYSILTAGGYWDDDGCGFREYHNSTGRYKLPPLKFYIRSDDPDRLVWGRDYMLYELLAAGLPVEDHIAPKTVCWEAVMKMPYNYHLYTGGWGPYRDPDFLYDQYHSLFGIEYWKASRDWANNYVFFTNSTFDYWAEKLKFAPDVATAQEGCMKCQEILMDQVPMIPGWHSAGAIGYRKNYNNIWSGEERYWNKPWKGIVNTKVISGMGTGGANGWWTFLSAHAEGFERGGTMRYGFMTDADVLNPVQADFYWDWEALNKVYDFLITCDPYTGEDIPWLAKSWTIDTWEVSPGKLASKFTLKLYDNILWHDNQQFTSYDVAFTFQYMKDAYASLFYPLVLDFDHADTPDPYTVVIYYKVLSMFGLHWIGGIPMIPQHIWQDILPTQSREKGEYETTGKLTGTGPYRFVSREKGQWLLLEANPTFFRKVVRPDWYTPGQSVPYWNGKIDLDDFMATVGHFGCTYSWPHSTIDPWADVNKDLVVDLDDIMEIGVRYGQTGYSKGYPGYYGA